MISPGCESIRVSGLARVALMDVCDHVFGSGEE